MPNSMYSSKQTYEIVGITYRQLDYWARSGIFIPTEQAQGSGSRRQYSYEDLVSLRVIKSMLDNGMELKNVKRAISYLKEHGMEVGNADLIMNKDSVFLHDSNQPQALIDLIKTGQGVFTIVALSQAVKEVDSEIATIKPQQNNAIGRQIA